MKLSLTILLTSLLTSSLMAQKTDTLEGIRADLKKSTTILNQGREQRNAERIELSTTLTKTQQKLIQKRRQARLARMGQADRAEAMRQLRNQATTQTQEETFLSNQLASYLGKFSTSLLQGEQVDLPDSVKITDRLLALEAGISRLENALGGMVLAVDGVGSEGKIKRGKLAAIGPAMWFQADDSGFGGAVVIGKGNRLVKVVDDASSDSKALISGEVVNAKVDLTGGKARALANINESPLSLFKKGGLWIYPVIAVALVAFLFALLKFRQLAQIRTPEAGWLSGLLEHVRRGDEQSIEEAISSCNNVSHPIGAVMSEALTGHKKGADMVEDMIYEGMISVQERLRRWLPFIAVTAAIAPLLGLLGTVSGMISTFNVIAVAGTGDPKPMAGGISEALVTTFFGLVVAIPALILHSLLSRKSQGIVQTTEKIGLRIVNTIRKNTK